MSRRRPHNTASWDWQPWDEDQFAQECDRQQRERYEEETAVAAPTRPDLTGIWELATAEAEQQMAAMRGRLRYEKNTDQFTAEEVLLLDEARSLLRAQIRRRMEAERWLKHLHGKELGGM